MTVSLGCAQMKNKRMNENGYTEEARTIFGMCNKHAPSLHNEVFAEWFLRAFPSHRVSDGDEYILEWIQRFQKGTPFIYMDNERVRVYLQLVKEWCGVEE